MKTNKKLLAGLVSASLVFGVAGCSSDDSSSVGAQKPFTVEAPLAAQTATIVINDPNGVPTVTVSTPAANITLAGTASIPVAGSVDVVLTATNNASRILTNLKAVIDPASVVDSTAGTPTVTTSSGSYNTDPYTYFGPAVAVGADATSGYDGQTLRIGGIAGGATSVTFNVTMPTDHPIIASARWTGENGYYLIDSATGERTFVDTDSVAMYQDDGGVTSGVSSADGTRLYMGSRNTGDIIVTDLNTIAADAAATPTPTYENSVSAIQVSDAGIANVFRVALSVDGKTLYALVNEGGHRWYDVDNWYNYGNAMTARLVKVDVATGKVKGDVAMFGGDYTARARGIDFTADGNTAVVVNSSFTQSQLDIINLSSMTVTKSIDVPMDVNNDQLLRAAAISADGKTVYAMYRDDYDNNSDLIVADVASGSVKRITVDKGIWTAYQMDFDKNGMLYIATDAGFFRFNPATGLMTDLSGSGVDSLLVAFDASGDRVYHTQRGSSPVRSYAYDVATGAQIDTDGNDDGTVGYLSMNLGSSMYSHLHAVSTY